MSAVHFLRLTLAGSTAGWSSWWLAWLLLLTALLLLSSTLRLAPLHSVLEPLLSISRTAATARCSLCTERLLSFSFSRLLLLLLTGSGSARDNSCSDWTWAAADLVSVDARKVLRPGWWRRGSCAGSLLRLEAEGSSCWAGLLRSAGWWLCWGLGWLLPGWGAAVLLRLLWIDAAAEPEYVGIRAVCLGLLLGQLTANEGLHAVLLTETGCLGCWLGLLAVWAASSV
ncbi:hypothetical protein Tco_0257764 [Tanacetum coccineum]